MKIYYLIDADLGWNNVVLLSTSMQKCVEIYTEGETVLETEEEVKEWLKKHHGIVILNKFLKN